MINAIEQATDDEHSNDSTLAPTDETKMTLESTGSGSCMNSQEWPLPVRVEQTNDSPWHSDKARSGICPDTY